MVSKGACFSPLYLHSSWTLRTTYQRSDHICSIISWLQEGRCLALPQMKGSPLLITSVFFLSSLLSRAAPSLGEISLQYSSGEMQPCQSNYITLIARLETTIEALFPVTPPPPSPLGGPHVNVVLKESVCFERPALWWESRKLASLTCTMASCSYGSTKIRAAISLFLWKTTLCFDWDF